MDFDAWKRRPNSASLSRLLESVEQRVERICRRILKDPHDAEEAKQEVLLEISSGLTSVVDAAHFDRWVGKVAFRTALDRRRMRLRRIAREHEAAGRVPNGATRDDALHESMSRLDEEDRELLIERFFDRRTLREMGERRGISAVAARKRLAGAQDRLKRMLGAGVPIALIVGASTVNAKTAVTACAIVLIVVLAGRIHLANRNRTPQRPQSVSGSPERTGILESSNAGVLSPIIEIPLPEKSAPSSEDRRLWTLERLKEYATAARQHYEIVCQDPTKHFTPEAKALQELMSKQLGVLREQAAGDAQKLAGALFDPLVCIEFLKTPDGHFVRFGAGPLLHAAIEAEIESEDSAAGPVLSELLPLARGDPGDRIFVLSVVHRLQRGNRDIAELCFQALEDPMSGVREEGLHALCAHAALGNLRESITRHGELLKGLVEGGLDKDRPGREPWLDGQKAAAFEILAAVNTPEVDEYLVARMESSASAGVMMQRAETLARFAPRVLQAQPNRFAVLMKQAADLPFKEAPWVQIIRLSVQLPAEVGVDNLRYAAARLPADEVDAIRGVEAVIRWVESGRASTALKEIERTVKNAPGLQAVRALAISTAN